MAAVGSGARGDHRLLVRVYAVIHRCEKKIDPGRNSALEWTALGTASWCDLHVYVNSSGESMKLEGTFEDGSIFGVNNISCSSWRWGRRNAQDRFCTLQRFRHATGAYGFFFPDSGTADRITLIVSKYIPPKESGSKVAPSEVAPTSSDGASAAVGASDSPSTGPSGTADPFLPAADVGEWLSGKQFGVAVADLKCADTDAYGAVPNILLFLAGQLKGHGGLDKEGIFRVSGQKTKVAAARTALDSGDVAQALSNMDANVAANLIKLWFRELQPQALLNCLAESQMVPAANGNDDAIQSLMEDEKAMPPLQRGIFMWLLDLLCAVVSNEPVNRMGPQAAGVVLAPNLWQSENANPIRDIELAQQAAKFLQKALKWRLASLGASA